MFETGNQSYHLIRKICKKFCFTLYEGRDNISGQIRFIKVLSNDMLSGGVYVEQFSQCAYEAKVLKSEHICRVYECRHEQDHHIIMSEYVGWPQLNQIIQAAFPMPLTRVIRIASGIAAVLRYAHDRGVIHGFLNPACIFVGPNDEIKLDDFGFGWVTPHLMPSGDTEEAYLSHYMSPEVYHQAPLVDAKNDIYAMGAILLQMLTGDFKSNGELKANFRPEYLAGSFPALRRAYDETGVYLEQIIRRCLRPVREDRYQNLNDFIEELDLVKYKTLSPPQVIDNKQETESLRLVHDQDR